CLQSLDFSREHFVTCQQFSAPCIVQGPYGVGMRAGCIGFVLRCHSQSSCLGVDLSSASAANSGAINSANQRAERSKDRATATRLFVHQERVCAADEFVDVCNFFAAIADTCYF